MRLMKAMPAEDNFYGEQETIREIVPDSLYQLLLPPTDVGYTSKERFCEEIQQFTIQHGYKDLAVRFSLAMRLTVATSLASLCSSTSAAVAPRSIKYLNIPR